MAFFLTTQPRRTVYRPPARWAWGIEYDPFDLFSEFIGHHPSTLMGFPSLAIPSVTGQSSRQAKQQEEAERKWHKIVKLPPYFTPEDFSVKSEGRVLHISAVREVKEEDGSVDRCEVQRQVQVPDQVDMDSVKTLWLKRGGILVVGCIQKPAIAPDTAPKEEESKPMEAKQEPASKETESEAAAQPGERKGLERQLSIDVENFGTQMKSFASDIHEALFGESLPKPDPDEVIPMEYEEKPEKMEEAGEKSPTEGKAGDLQEIKLDVSGYKPDEVKVSVDQGMVKVSGHHTDEDSDHMAVYHFQRSFTLPEGAITSKVTSKVDEEKGTLVISVPTQPKAIEYKESS